MAGAHRPEGSRGLTLSSAAGRNGSRRPGGGEDPYPGQDV